MVDTLTCLSWLSLIINLITNPVARVTCKASPEKKIRAKVSLEAAQQKQTSLPLNQSNQLVLLSTKNFAKNRGHKLLPKCMGPFVVQQKIGPIAVKLRLPETMRCHNVFHDSW
jgi:hypothetical protein